jgi:mRNA-degrading endonuclease RelE of RelBE toxin-antitoxin system
VKVEWEDGAKASFRSSVMRDQEGAVAVLAAIDALADDPLPGAPLGVHRGDDWHRLHVGPYRVVYFVDGDVVAIRRVDKVLS